VQSFLAFGTGCRCAVGVSKLPYTGRVLSVVGLNVVAKKISPPFLHELITDCPAMFM